MWYASELYSPKWKIHPILRRAPTHNSDECQLLIDTWVKAAAGKGSSLIPTVCLDLVQVSPFRPSFRDSKFKAAGVNSV